MQSAIADFLSKSAHEVITINIDGYRIIILIYVQLNLHSRESIKSLFLKK